MRPLREDRRYLEERRCRVFLAALDDLRPLLRRVRLVFLRDLLRDLPPKLDDPGDSDSPGGTGGPDGPDGPYATPNFPVDRFFSASAAAAALSEELIPSAFALLVSWSNWTAGCSLTPPGPAGLGNCNCNGK